ncbi:MAG TPA: hypothetical protein DCF68_21825 [Cyanothece sp. UBA12306]|nr:hypothetical protein [Cyanothece sp. UBA12306]
MRNLISSLTLTTASLSLGLLSFSAGQAQAGNFSQSLPAVQTNYYNSNNLSGTNPGNTSNFLQVGRLGSDPNGPANGVQNSYLGFNFQALHDQLNDIKINTGAEGVEVRNMVANLYMTQTNNDPDNPNDNPGPRPFPTFTRISNLQGVAVTGSWSDDELITAPPTEAPPPILFGSNNVTQGENSFANVDSYLNEFLTDFLNAGGTVDYNPDNPDVDFSIGLKAASVNHAPSFDFYGIESFFSGNDGNSGTTPRLEITRSYRSNVKKCGMWAIRYKGELPLTPIPQSLSSL